jgi:acyl dehydratase
MGRIAQDFKDAAFEDFVCGDVFHTTHHLDPAVVAEYDRLVEAPGSRATVPPWVYCTFLPMFRAMDSRMKQGSIHARQTMTVHGSAAVGATLDVEVRVAEKYERAGRRHLVLEIVFSDAERPVCTSTGTYLWGYATR